MHLSNPIESASAVTPADGADLASNTHAIYVGSAGTLKVTLIDGRFSLTGNAANLVYAPLCGGDSDANAVLAGGTSIALGCGLGM